MITVSIIEDIASFSALREEWDELLRDSPADCIFLSWEWLYVWWLNMSQGRSLFILAVRYDQKLIAIAPLTIIDPQLSRLRPIRVMEFLGSGSVGSDYLDVIVRSGFEGEALTALARKIADRRLVLQLAYVDSKSTLLTRFVTNLARVGWRIKSTPITHSPYAELSGMNWEAYLASLSTKHRSVYLKKYRKLNRDFDARLEMAVTEEQRKQYLAILIDLHLKRWSENGGSNAFNSASLLAFHEQFSTAAFSRGWLRLYVLWLDGVPAAAVYGFEYGNAFYYYQAGYGPEYSNYSVGSMCIGMTIRIAMEANLDRYDFLHGSEEYKFSWAKESREMLRLDMFPPTLLGSVYQESLRLRKSLKNALAPRIVKKAHH